MARSQLPVSIARLAYVDTAQLEENHEFELSSTSLKTSAGENCFKLQLLEHPLQEVCAKPVIIINIRLLQTPWDAYRLQY